MESKAEDGSDRNPGATIETERLWLRSMREDDLDALLRIFTDRRVMAAFASEPFDRAQMQGWLDRNLRHQREHGYGLFAVIDKADGALIGDCGLEVMEVDGGREAELGYDFLSAYWGRGLATEAASAVRDHAFGVLGLTRLVSLIRQGNEASRRVAEKVGMQHERDIVRGPIPYWLYAMPAPIPDGQPS
ncbi:MAG: GNAT family N-acetyltransferase [Chloroflexota bacterium]|nr:GNAT family N-acetyltransferase [Chloroflexota bacterium]